MQSRIKVIGEGGIHIHRLAAPTETEKDGLHKHLFFVGDRLLMTDLSGDHLHMVRPVESAVVWEDAHGHTVTIQTEQGPVVLKTEGNSGHTHELQSETTTLSGLHIHFLPVAQDYYPSILPGDLIDAVQENVKSVPALKNFKIDRDGDNPMEMDFPLVKRLNKSDFKEVLQKSIFCAVMKGFSRLKEGLQVESLVLSRERFFDLGSATRFVLDSGLAINGAEERPESYFFTIRAKERFDESSLQRVRITEGVEAVIGMLLEDEVHNQEGDTVEGGIAELTDRNKTEEETVTTEESEDEEMGDLQSKFASIKGLFSDDADDLKVVKRVEWDGVTKKDANFLGDTTVCNFCGITDEEEKTAIGAGIRRNVCLVCALDRMDSGVFDGCCDGTFDFSKYAEQYPDDVGVKRYLEAQKAAEETTKRSFEILKRDDERRLIYGPVLIPENFDLQDDIISAGEIENAAHNYLVKLSFHDDPEFLQSLGMNAVSKRGFMHTEFNRKIAVVESYIAPVDFEMGGRTITKGTWVGVVKVFDDEVWNLVKAGRITGFSIGGRSRSIPVEG